MRNENKCKPIPRIEINDLWSLKNFKIKIIPIYNKLPMKLTLITNHLQFKKYLKIYRLKPNIINKIPIYPENTMIDNEYLITTKCTHNEP